MKVKMGFLAFQQARNEDNRPSVIEDMIKFPNHAKPAYLPYMGDPILASNQNQEWEPDDLDNV